MPNAQRDDLWNVVKYPCIGRWGFTNLHTASNGRFDVALKRLLSAGGANEDAILDIGCCVGQVLRHFAYKGVDPARLFGTDLHPEFIGIGDELFKDKGRGPTFVAGDMLDADDEPLKALDGKVTMVQAANFFHLFTWDDQVKIGSRIIRFLKPGTTDAVIFGRQIGTIKPRAIEVLQGRYLHDQSSFQRLWDEIGEKTGTKWRVEAEVIEGVPVTLPVFGEDERYIRFGVYQVSPPAIP
jgi:SAM-dependent methyltransferase